MGGPPPSRVPAHLPGAESLEEEEEREAPDHGGADDAEQGDELDSLPAPELGEEGRERGEPPEGHSSPLSWRLTPSPLPVAQLSLPHTSSWGPRR